MAKKKAKTKTKFADMGPDALVELGFSGYEWDAYAIEELLDDYTLNTLLHTKDLKDACKVLEYYNIVSKNWQSMEAMCENHPKEWSRIFQRGRSEIAQVPDCMTLGVYYLTNAMSEEGEVYFVRRIKELDASDITDPFEEFNEPPEDIEGLGVLSVEEPAAGPDVPDEDDDLTEEWGRFTDAFRGIAPSEVSRYMMSPDSRDYSRMKLYLDGGFLCRIEFDESTGGLYVSDDFFPYWLESKGDGVVEVYDRVYFGSLKPYEQPDPYRMIAKISWCVADEENKTGVSRLELHRDTDTDSTDLLLLLAASPFIMYQLQHSW